MEDRLEMEQEEEVLVQHLFMTDDEALSYNKCSGT